MGIDYVINYGCVPKERLTTEGLLQRLKAGERAQSIIDFYRRNNDQRPIDQMGGEVMRRAVNGEEETQTVLVSDLLAQRAELQGLEHHCMGCPANRRNAPFGCIGHINYPISQDMESWMLYRLPQPEETLPFILLSRAEEFGCTGKTARALRENNPGMIFASGDTLVRRYPDLEISSDQLFELFFLVDKVIPVKRVVMLLLFMGAIERNLEADQLIKLTPAPVQGITPFLVGRHAQDDRSITDFKGFLESLYLAYTLDRDVLLDV